MQLTNERLDKIWSEAAANSNDLVLDLLEEIDMLKSQIGNADIRRIRLKQISTRTLERSKSKYLHRGQSYFRNKAAAMLLQAGYTEASQLVFKCHVDYSGWEELRNHKFV